MSFGHAVIDCISHGKGIAEPERCAIRLLLWWILEAYDSAVGETADVHSRETTDRARHCRCDHRRSVRDPDGPVSTGLAPTRSSSTLALFGGLLVFGELFLDCLADKLCHAFQVDKRANAVLNSIGNAVGNIALISMAVVALPLAFIGLIGIFAAAASN